LKLKCDILVSKFAFKFNSCRYAEAEKEFVVKGINPLDPKTWRGCTS
jgi:hypothetical protein